MNDNDLLALVRELRDAILAYKPCPEDNDCGTEPCKLMRRAVEHANKALPPSEEVTNAS